jgi:hypothetical protein
MRIQDCRLTTEIVFETLDQAVSPDRGLAACCRFRPRNANSRRRGWGFCREIVWYVRTHRNESTPFSMLKQEKLDGWYWIDEGSVTTEVMKC